MYRRCSRFLIVALAVLFVSSLFPQWCLAASAKDSKTIAPAPSPATNQKVIQKKPDPTRMKMDTQRLRENLPELEILSFKKKVEVAPGTMRATRPGYVEPTSTAIDLGEQVTLGWRIKGCRVRSVMATLSGEGSVNPGTQSSTSEDCIYFSGEHTLRPQRSETYTLTVSAQPESGHVTLRPATATFRVEVRRPQLTLRPPEVNQDTLNVVFPLRNTGDADFRPTPINVQYEIYGSIGTRNVSITSGSFRTPRIEISRGRTVELGSISLEPFRDRVLSYDAMALRVRAGASYVQPLEEDLEMFTHRWTNETFVLNELMLSMLDSISECEIRLNNYQAGRSGWPEIRNDSFIRFAVGGTGSPVPLNLRAQTYRVRVTGRVSGHDYIDERVGLFLNEITSVTPPEAQLFEIRDGKLGIHLEFENTGAHEIKLGTTNDSHNRFDDAEVPDINIGAFSVDAWLTPAAAGDKITYNRIEVVVPTIRASLTGRFDGLNPIIRDYLSGYVTDEVRRQLNSVLGNATIKRSIEDGIAGALSGRSITHIVEVRGAGDTITVVYR